MRITFVMPAGSMAGGNRVVAIYAERLARRGHSVHVAWNRHAPIGLRQRVSDLARARWSRPRADGCTYFDGLPVTQSILDVPRPITDADLPDADAVIATWWTTAFEVSALAPSKGAKFYFVQHHEVFEWLPHHLSRGSYYLPLHKITISRWLADIMARDYGDRDVELVPNSVDPGLFHAPVRDKGYPPRVGFMYSATPFKGTRTAARAIAAARAEMPELEVAAFGTDTPDAAMPLPPGTAYHRNPPQARLREIYAACDVWLCSSREEGFGLPILEAMACRTPVVSTRVGAAPQLISDGVEGWITEIGDAETLGRRIAEVARLSPVRWRAMSEAAHARILSYSWDDATDRFEAALRRRVFPQPSRKVG